MNAVCKENRLENVFIRVRTRFCASDARSPVSSVSSNCSPVPWMRQESCSQVAWNAIPSTELFKNALLDWILYCDSFLAMRW